MIQQVIDDPAGPVWWGKNQAGMQAREELEGIYKEDVKAAWLVARDQAVETAQYMLRNNAHKQIVNRLLEPWMWITVIATATHWNNFFNQRCDSNAQPEIQKIAYMMRDLYVDSTPQYRDVHLPLIRPDEWSDTDGVFSDVPPDLLGGTTAARELLPRVSVARCARVSYLTHDGKRSVLEDLKLFKRLTTSGHWSPFEHVATAQYGRPMWSGNFYGWNQYRKSFQGEHRSTFFPPDSPAYGVDQDR